MDLSTVIEFLQQFETRKVMETLETLNLQELIRNPYFLGGTGAVAILAFLMHWRLLLTVVLAVTGFIGLLAYTFEQGVSLEGGVGSDSLMIFVIGGAALVFLVIYMLFIRGE